MTELKLTEKELNALLHCLKSTYKTHNHNWFNEIESILTKIRGS